MDKVKTFPLHFPERFLDRIGEAAKKNGESKADFIIKAIYDRIEKESEK